MARYMLSWIAQKHGAQDLKTFRASIGTHCLVWEPGEWRPPAKDGDTVVTDPGASRTPKAGAALVIYLEPAPDARPLVVGRDAACDLVLDDATVSSRHLTLIPREGGWSARSDGSTNGTWLNGRPLAPEAQVPLTPADQLRVGQVALTYYDPKGLYFRLKTGS